MLICPAVPAIGQADQVTKSSFFERMLERCFGVDVKQCPGHRVADSLAVWVSLLSMDVYACVLSIVQCVLIVREWGNGGTRCNKERTEQRSEGFRAKADNCVVCAGLAQGIGAELGWVEGGGADQPSTEPLLQGLIPGHLVQQSSEFCYPTQPCEPLPAASSFAAERLKLRDGSAHSTLVSSTWMPHRDRAAERQSGRGGSHAADQIEVEADYLA
jgi:hypothetical protein